MTPEKQTLLKELARSAYGDALRTLITEALEEVGDVSKCTSWEDTVGRQKAKDFLNKTFSFLNKKDVVVPTKNTYT